MPCTLRVRLSSPSILGWRPSWRPPSLSSNTLEPAPDPLPCHPTPCSSPQPTAWSTRRMLNQMDARAAPSRRRAIAAGQGMRGIAEHREMRTERGAGQGQGPGRGEPGILQLTEEANQSPEQKCTERKELGRAKTRAGAHARGAGNSDCWHSMRWRQCTGCKPSRLAPLCPWAPQRRHVCSWASAGAAPRAGAVPCSQLASCRGRQPGTPQASFLSKGPTPSPARAICRLSSSCSASRRSYSFSRPEGRGRGAGAGAGVGRRHGSWHAGRAGCATAALLLWSHAKASTRPCSRFLGGQGGQGGAGRQSCKNWAGKSRGSCPRAPSRRLGRPSAKARPCSVRERCPPQPHAQQGTCTACAARPTPALRLERRHVALGRGVLLVGVVQAGLQL